MLCVFVFLVTVYFVIVMSLSMTAFVSTFRLQHHESPGGQREPALQQRPPVGGGGRGQPRRRHGSGHAPSDRRPAQPQVPPVPTPAPPPATPHAPPTGRGDRAQRRRRVLIGTALTPPPPPPPHTNSNPIPEQTFDPTQPVGGERRGMDSARRNKADPYYSNLLEISSEGLQ